MATKKYRPYFTLAELKTLRGFCTSIPVIPGVDFTISEKTKLFRYLDKYIIDIEHTYRKANHTLVPSIAEKLGFISPNDDNNDNEEPNSQEDADERYNRDHANRYANDQMSPQEEKEYEATLFRNSQLP